MDDFHKPTLDAIGFQELITEEAAAWNTELEENYTPSHDTSLWENNRHGLNTQQT